MSVSILVVDDESDVAELFRQQFRREARQGTYVLHFAYSGGEALDKLAAGIEPPLIDRTTWLAALLSNVPSPLQYCDHQIGRGREFHKQACAISLEGIVPKRADARWGLSPQRRTDREAGSSGNRSRPAW